LTIHASLDRYGYGADCRSAVTMTRKVRFLRGALLTKETRVNLDEIKALKAGNKVWLNDRFRTVEYLVESPVIILSPGTVESLRIKLSHQGNKSTLQFLSTNPPGLFYPGDPRCPYPIKFNNGGIAI